MDNHFKPDSKSDNSQEDIEFLRIELAEKARLALEKYEGEIKKFSLMVCSPRDGFVESDFDVHRVRYEEKYDNEFKTDGVPRNDRYYKEGSGYLMDIPNNIVTFCAYLGRTLHTTDRLGNSIYFTLAGEKGKKFSDELINSVGSLMKTLVSYEKSGNDVKNIIKETLPVLEMLRELGQKFSGSKRNFVESLIEEYKKELDSLDSRASN